MNIDRRGMGRVLFPWNIICNGILMLPWQRLQGQFTNNTPLMFGSYWGVEKVLLYFLASLVDDAFNFDSWCVL